MRADRAEPRWLPPESAADYIGVRVDELPRLLRSGKLPEPSRHLGPRKPRYDRLALDALFGGGTVADDRAEEAAIVDSIIARAHRQKAAGGRHGARISLPQEGPGKGRPVRA